VEELRIIPSDSVNDAKFVSHLLLILFGSEELKTITLTGVTRGKEKVKAMDPMKKLFIRGSYTFSFYFISNCSVNCIFSTEMFMQRLLSEKDEEKRSERIKKLNRHITQKIENLKKLDRAVKVKSNEK
jgi:hypothetical protein